MRKFEIISQEQWNKDITLPCGLRYTFNSINTPKRSTKNSAGYDFVSPIDITVPAHGTAKIPTGIKAQMNDNEVLFIIIRSSLGFKYNLKLSNQVGVIDSDYYNNADNEGHIFIKFYNPTDTCYEISVGDKIAQGIFINYLTVDNEENIETERNSGIGSTGK